MKAILASIRPQHVANILNGLKTLEIRKKFPKDYVGWVYIYVTHGKQLLDLRNVDTKDNYRLTERKSNNVRWSYPPLLNGKVVARFWCENVEEFLNPDNYMFVESCLSKEELGDYLGFNKGYAVHISDLVIFDKPKEISEFNVVREYTNCGCCPHALDFGCSSDGWCGTIKPLTRAPQSWCFIEV